jgi:hypothetical protein
VNEKGRRYFVIVDGRIERCKRCGYKRALALRGGRFQARCPVFEALCKLRKARLLAVI